MSQNPLPTKRSDADQSIIARDLAELVTLERLISKLSLHGRVTTEAKVDYAGLSFPIYALEFGPDDPTTPVIAFVGGVHGLERIGTGIIIEYLKTFKELLYWDNMLSHLLSQCRVIFYPMVNPGGIFAKTRSNTNSVDLMRNAPIDADHEPKVKYVCGHRISPMLPWYRGALGEPMELEAQALCDYFKARVFPARYATSLDIHSGFGRVDRLWFPYAYSKKPFPHHIEMFAMKRKLDQALPNHVYVVEPQSHQYATHGDLWDYLYLAFTKQNPHATFLPLTLEMGSWLWVKKNPWQVFNPLGIFNPLLPHRTKRILRRHTSLMDFLMRITASYKRWSYPPEEKKQLYRTGALSVWYKHHAL